MPTHKKSPLKNYRLISAYITLDKDKREDEVQNKIIAQRIKAFHIFCVVVFSSFLLDGLLPYQQKSVKIKGIKTLFTTNKTIVTKRGTKTLVLPTMAEINTTHGGFITTDITGHDLVQTQAYITKTRIFSIAQSIHLPHTGNVLKRFFNFHGAFIFWPLLALAISCAGAFYKKTEGSTTLSVLSILNIIPFFTTVFMT